MCVCCELLTAFKESSVNLKVIAGQWPVWNGIPGGCFWSSLEGQTTTQIKQTKIDNTNWFFNIIMENQHV